MNMSAFRAVPHFAARIEMPVQWLANAAAKLTRQTGEPVGVWWDSRAALEAHLGDPDAERRSKKGVVLTSDDLREEVESQLQTPSPSLDIYDIQALMPNTIDYVNAEACQGLREQLADPDSDLESPAALWVAGSPLRDGEDINLQNFVRRLDKKA
jgi:hypothetical protein